MKVLVIDSLQVCCLTLARELRDNLRREVLCASSTNEALDILRREKDRIGIIVLTLEMSPERDLLYIKRIKEFCIFAGIRLPRFVVLSPGPLTDGYSSRFRDIGAQCLLQGYFPQVCYTVRSLIFDALRGNGQPTILVDRLEAVPRFSLLGVPGSEPIRFGPRLIPMMNYFAVNFGTELATTMLADVAEISLDYVRVYLKRLRDRYDEARLRVGVETLGKEVFCTLRRDGAFVHILRAQVRFI